MSKQATSKYLDNKNIIKELIRSSPKKYKAIVISDSEDEDQKKAILISDSENYDDNSYTSEYNYKMHNNNKKNKNYSDSYVEDYNTYATESDYQSNLSYTTNGDYTPSISTYSTQSNLSYDSEQSYNDTYDPYSSCATYNSNCSSNPRICPNCSKVLSDSSYLTDDSDASEDYESVYDSVQNSESYVSDNEDPIPYKSSKKRFDPRVELKQQRRATNTKRILDNRLKCDDVPSPQVIISPRQPSPMRLAIKAKNKEVKSLLERCYENLVAKKAAEKQRREEEARKKAEEEIIRKRKKCVKELLEQLRIKKENPDRYISIYRRPVKCMVDDSDSYLSNANSYYSDYSDDYYSDDYEDYTYDSYAYSYAD